MKAIGNIPDELNDRIHAAKSKLGLKSAVAVLEHLISEFEKPPVPKPEPVQAEPPAPLSFPKPKAAEIPDPPGLGYAFENTAGHLLADEIHGVAICMDKAAAYSWLRAGEDKMIVSPWSIRPVYPTAVDVQALRDYEWRQWNECVEGLPPNTIFLDEYRKRFMSVGSRTG